MEFHFICPKTGKAFQSSEYYLHDGYEIVVDDTGDKQLIGRVALRSACPFCGEFHSYRTDEVICPYDRK